MFDTDNILDLGNAIKESGSGLNPLPGTGPSIPSKTELTDEEYKAALAALQKSFKEGAEVCAVLQGVVVTESKHRNKPKDDENEDCDDCKNKTKKGKNKMKVKEMYAEYVTTAVEEGETPVTYAQFCEAVCEYQNNDEYMSEGTATGVKEINRIIDETNAETGSNYPHVTKEWYAKYKSHALVQNSYKHDRIDRGKKKVGSKNHYVRNLGAQAWMDEHPECSGKNIRSSAKDSRRKREEYFAGGESASVLESFLDDYFGGDEEE